MEIPIEANKLQFWGAIQIYVRKPHILNRRICGTTTLWSSVGHLKLCPDDNQETIKDLVKNVIKVLNNYTDNNSVVKLLNNYNDNNSVSLNNVVGGLGLDNVPTVATKSHASNISENLLITVENIKEIFDNSWTILEQCDEDKSECSSSENNNNNNSNESSLIRKLNEGNGFFVEIRQILPKCLKIFQPIIEVVILDLLENVAYFLSECLKGKSVIAKSNYFFKYDGKSIQLNIIDLGNSNDLESNKDDGNVEWLHQNVLPRLAKWAEDMSTEHLVDSQGSLHLIPVAQYNCLYQQLKDKYGRPLVEMWPETTDPLKFVYEDIAIATYLLVLWDQERITKRSSTKQSFIDLGCGNGLLVYILTNEGHLGLGVDIKKRKIWDLFPDFVRLKEMTIEPSDKHLMPEYDWLIGNHSDELTPWIPVIAAKSSQSTKFFVIPCCPFDFENKYKRQQSGLSQYAEYLDYVINISKVCGFKVSRDKLRIPSTKRTCIIGSERTYGENIEENNKTINQFILKNCQRYYSNVEDNSSNESKLNNDLIDSNCDGVSKRTVNSWSSNFQPREAIQTVKNCTHIDQSIKEEVVTSVANTLLRKKHIIQAVNEDGCKIQWNCGGTVALADLAGILTTQQLKALKSECGGLQTLLKNHRNVFAVYKGNVKLQIPIPASKGKVSPHLLRTKPCWYYHNHNQGCPLSAESCMFAHTDVGQL